MKLSHVRYVLLLALLFSLPLSAQIVIRGNISDAETNEPAQNAIIKVYSPTDYDNIISYTVSDRKGNYTLEFQTTEKDIELEFSMLGYETFKQKVKAESTIINHQLKFSSQLLKEVTIKAPPISSRNDTINYNVSAFISQSDRNVEDILRKLPGITVQQNGQIEYQGKPINKFYIEGLDMLEGRYSLATKNIAANQITSVQVYENHQPIKLLKGIDFSENAGLNIKLKNKKMSRPVGNMLIGGGGGNDNQTLYRTEVFGFMANMQQQILFSAKANNSGISSHAELASHYNASGRTIKADEYISALPFVVPMQIAMRTKKTTDLSASINTIRKIDEHSNIKLNILYSKEQKSYLRSSTSSYFTGINATVIQEEIKAEDTENKVSGMTVYEKNKDSLFIKNTTNAEFYFGSAHADIIMNTEKMQDFSIKKMTFNNNLSLIWRKGKNVYNIQSLILGGFMPQSKLYVLNPDNSKLASQDNSGKLLYTRTSSSFIKGFNANSNLSIDLMVETEYDKIETHLNNQSEKIQTNNNNSGYKIISTLNPAYSYDKGRIRVKINTPLEHISIKYRDILSTEEFVHNKPFISPGIHSRYIINPALFITASAKISQTTGDITSFVVNPIQTAYNRIQYTESGILAHRKNTILSMGYDYRNTMNGVFSSFTTHYSRTRKNTIRGNNISNDSIISSLATGIKNYSHNYVSNLYLAKNFQELRTTIALTSNYTYSKNKKIRQNQQINYTYNIFALTPSVNVRAVSWLSLRLQNPLQVFTQIINDNSLSPKSRLFNWAANIDISLLPHEKIELYYLLDYKNNHVAGYKNREQWAFMDVGVRYQPTKRIELELRLQNITNIKVYTITNYQEGDKFTTDYYLRPFNGMINFKYSF